MAEFTYNNAKNTSIANISFELNCSYYPYVFFEENINLHFQSKTVKQLSGKLKKRITICQKNLYHVQELQKQAKKKRQA